MNNRLFLASKICLQISTSMMLSGCIAAAAPLMLAMGATAAGFFGYKTYQSATAGEVSIGFSEDEDSIKNQQALSDIASPAVWPTSRVEAVTAQKLANSGKFRKVISPIQVAEAVSRNQINSAVSLMTEMEVAQTFVRVCSVTEADSVIYMGEPAITGATNFFSLKSPALAYESKMFVYVCGNGLFAYKGARRLEIETTMPEAMGTNTSKTSAIPDDVIEFAGDSTAERLLEIIAPTGNFEIKPTSDSEMSSESREPSQPQSGFNSEVAELQLALTKKGYSPGPIDGLWGAQTRKALEKFQSDQGLEVTGEMDVATKSKLHE